jgi:hypothetical protein
MWGSHERDEGDGCGGWSVARRDASRCHDRAREFLHAYDKGGSDLRVIMEPLVRQFVREGYHHVPDWTDLAFIARALILEKGYRDKDIAEIAKEAAIANGMSK